MEQIVASLPSYQQAPGRQVHLSMDHIDRYIDYAHTPNGLDVMLQYLHSIKGTGRLICLFGAPGLRDRYKRPDMARVVEALSDIMIITEDDSATENTWQIISDIVAGVQRKEGESLAIIPDRRLAIRYLCAIAQPGDVVLLAGKGHEKVLLTNAGKIPRSDETVLKEERQKK